MLAPLATASSLSHGRIASRQIPRRGLCQILCEAAPADTGVTSPSPGDMGAKSGKGEGGRQLSIKAETYDVKGFYTGVRASTMVEVPVDELLRLMTARAGELYPSSIQRVSQLAGWAPQTASLAASELVHTRDLRASRALG